MTNDTYTSLLTALASASDVLLDRDLTRGVTAEAAVRRIDHAQPAAFFHTRLEHATEAEMSSERLVCGQACRCGAPAVTEART